MKNLIPGRRKRKNDNMPAEPWRSDLLERFFDDPCALTKDFFSDRSGFPRMDISDRKKDIIVEAEIPGMEKKDIDVRLDGRRRNQIFALERYRSKIQSSWLPGLIWTLRVQGGKSSIDLVLKKPKG